ncbi:MAG TPA: 30S ribosomal protein S14 [Fimbriimonadaceae bacterium]|nr:30S ribosomal protein S14 [Fimbriimonadaceae bacterium]HRJ32302.1 30S ribosomal protein S14 [Fimbriimonadaceae bacterium]
MAKQCHKIKQERLAAAWEEIRREEARIKELPKEAREEALAALKAKRIKNRLYKSRYYNRCSVTGRARGYFRYFGVCRQVLREMAHKGELPGVTKSSW